MVDHLAPVNNKVKGLLKGLRYISQIFDVEKEQEMVIGNPTDVKHVAHIGWEGPSASINEFNTPSLGQDGKEFGSTATEEIPQGVASSPSREPHHSRKSRSSGSGSDSQSQEGQKSRHHRHHSKHHSSANGSESTHQEVPKKTRKKERRRKGSDGVEEKVAQMVVSEEAL